MTEQPRPFRFKDCALITLALGRTARSLRELRDRVAVVPAASLQHHFVEGLLRPSFDDPEFPNDFALWARDALRDDALAERLAVIDPFALADAEALRPAVLDVLEDRLAEIDHAETVPEARQFHFLSSRLVVFSTGLEARQPEDVVPLMPRLSPGSVYFHFVDARLRPPRGVDDLAPWLAAWGGRGERASARLRGIEPTFGSLAELRRRLAAALAECLGEAA